MQQSINTNPNPVTGKLVRELIAAIATEVGIKPTVEKREMRDRLGFRLAKAAGLTEWDFNVVGAANMHDEEKCDCSRWDIYRRLVVACVAGGAMPKAFKAALEAGKVAIVGVDERIAKTFPKALGEHLPILDPGSEDFEANTLKYTHFIPNRRLNEDDILELEDDLGTKLNWVNPDDLAIQLVHQSQMGQAQVSALLLALGAEQTGTAFAYSRDYETLEVTITPKDGAVVNKKKVRHAVYFAGQLDGDLYSTDAIPWKALGWALTYAVCGQNVDSLMGRLVYLTELFQPQDAGAIVKGRVGAKYRYQGGVMNVYAGRGGFVNFVNGELDERCDLVDHCAVKGIPAIAQHQVGSVSAGKGSEACGVGVSVSLKPITRTVPFKVADITRA